MITGPQIVTIQQDGQSLEVPVESLPTSTDKDEIEPIVTSQSLRVKSVVLRKG
jgi:hypothetical protein